MSDDMVDFLARAQYAANSWWRAAKDDDDGLGRYKMHGDVRLRAIEWEHLYADEQDDFLQSARAILTAIEASGRRIVPVEPTPAISRLSVGMSTTHEMARITFSPPLPR